MPKDAQETQPHVDRDVLLQRIRTSLSQADSYTQRNKRLNSTLMIVTTTGSALTAFLTALTAAKGPVVIPGLLDWFGACSIGAVLSLITTICSGLSQQMDISRKLIEGSQCTGRLRALELVVTTQTRSVGEITTEYAEILSTFADTVK